MPVRFALPQRKASFIFAAAGSQRLRGIIFRLGAPAVERVETGDGRAMGGGQAVGRHPADPRRRRLVALTRLGLGVSVGVGLAVLISGRVVGVARGLLQRHVPRRDEAAALRAEQGRSQPLRVRGDGCERGQRKAKEKPRGKAWDNAMDEAWDKTWQKHAQGRRAPFSAPLRTRCHDENTPTKSCTSSTRSRYEQNATCGKCR